MFKEITGILDGFIRNVESRYRDVRLSVILFHGKRQVVVIAPSLPKELCLALLNQNKKLGNFSRLIHQPMDTDLIISELLDISTDEKYANLIRTHQVESMWVSALNAQEHGVKGLVCAFKKTDAHSFTASDRKNLKLVRDLMDVSLTDYSEGTIDEPLQFDSELLTSSELQLFNQDLFQGLQYGILFQDSDGLILDLNKAASDIIGKSPDKLKGAIAFQNDWNAIHEDGSAFSLDHCPAQMAIRTGEPIKDVCIGIYNADANEYRWLNVNSIPIKSEHDEVQYVYTLIEDISELKLTQQQLIEAKEKEEKRNQSRQQFLAKVSHEVRTPLNGIQGMAYLLKMTELNIEQREYVDAIDNSCDNLLVIVNDILDISKHESGNIVFKNKPFNLREVLQSVQQLLWVKADTKGVHFQVDVDPNVPGFIMGDQTRLNQILLNLVGNAVKFTQEGEVQLRVSQLGRVDDQCKLHFEISDTGIGIPNDKLEDIFTPFVRGDQNTANQYEGTGLGLPITKQLVDLMGGTLSIKSEHGIGTVCTVTLNYSISAGDISWEEENRKYQFSDKLKGKTVLLVDDNHVNLLWVRRLLESHGGRVLSVEGGEEAILTLQQKPVDFVLMDIHMPGMDGCETTERIRTTLDSPLSDIPIIGVTADVLEDNLERYMESGLNDFIGKPFDPDQLLDKISQALDKKVLGSSTKWNSKGTDKSLVIDQTGEEFDFKGIHHVSHGDPRFLKEFILEFMPVLDEAILNFPLYVKQGDEKALRDLFHRIIPNFKYFRIRVNREIQQIQSEVKQYGIESVDLEAVKKIVERLMHVRKALKKYLGNNPETDYE